MPLLTVEHHGARRTAPLARRLLIGRRGGNHVVIDDHAVAMIHAWIDKRGEECILTDTGSRAGTFVNGKRMTDPLPLNDGDVITVGPATLTFHGNGAPVAAEDDRSQAAGEVQQIEPAAPAAVEPSTEGWLFACACGAPLWAGSAFAGRAAYCRYCGREVQVPASATVVGPQLPATTLSRSFLGPSEETAASETLAPRSPSPSAPSINPAPASSLTANPSAAPNGRNVASPAVPPVANRAAAAIASATAPPPVDQLAAATSRIASQKTPPPPAAERPTASPTHSAPTTPKATEPRPTAAKATQTCGICQTGISARERTTTCPSCGLAFHADCWTENRGCSAYGCPQVGALDPKMPEIEADADDDAAATDDAAMEKAAGAYSVKPPFPWEYVTLAASAVCLLLSTLTFGVPSFLVGAATMAAISRKPGVRRKTGVLLLSTLLAFIGFVGGIALSWFWYFGSGGRDGA